VSASGALLVLGANNPRRCVVAAVNDREPTFTLVGFLDNDVEAGRVSGTRSGAVVMADRRIRTVSS
jgi:hypothetical protein